MNKDDVEIVKLPRPIESVVEGKIVLKGGPRVHLNGRTNHDWDLN